MTQSAERARTTDAPKRIQLSRAKGWRMPPNTIKVDRTTQWGNPFIVGANGSAAECVYQFILLMASYINISSGMACSDRQEKLFKLLVDEKKAGYPSLRGKNLACWCKPGAPCHADVLMLIANKPARKRIDLVKIMAGYGYRMESGRAVRIEKEAG